MPGDALEGHRLREIDAKQAAAGGDPRKGLAPVHRAIGQIFEMPRLITKAKLEALAQRRWWRVRRFVLGRPPRTHNRGRRAIHRGGNLHAQLVKIGSKDSVCTLANGGRSACFLLRAFSSVCNCCTSARAAGTLAVKYRSPCRAAFGCHSAGRRTRPACHNPSGEWDRTCDHGSARPMVRPSMVWLTARITSSSSSCR